VADIAGVTAELAGLWPALPEALARDTTAPGGGGSSWVPAGVVNADVLAAMIALSAAVPETVRYACDAIGEPWRHRDMAGCLRQVPRLASRMRDLGQAANERTLEHMAAGWLRTVKRALGLRKPDIPVGYACPYADTFPENHHDGRMLFMAGEDGFLRQGPDGPRVEFVAQEVIYCASQDCNASWAGKYEWTFLGSILGMPATVTA